MAAPPDKLNCIEEIQGKLGGLGRTRVFDLIASGQLASVKIGRRRFVPDSAIAAYVERLKSTA